MTEETKECHCCGDEHYIGEMLELSTIVGMNPDYLCMDCQEDY